MISNGDKCGVKGLQAHEFLSHSIKDGIKWRPSLMCHSCKKRRWRTRDEKSFQGKCDGEMCFRCPDTNPHHDLEFWFSTCLMRIKDLVLNWSIWVGTERWAGPVRRDAGSTLTTAIFKDAQHSQRRRAEGERWKRGERRASGLSWSPPELTFLKIHFDGTGILVNACVYEFKLMVNEPCTSCLQGLNNLYFYLTVKFGPKQLLLK